jgi:methionyl-tRNA synthetase
MRKTLVFATPPTPNGDLHLGHLSGPYLRADIYTRYSRMRGVETYYLTGADDHQSYVAYKGEQVGLSPAETADKFGEMMRRTLEAAHIAVDVYARPRQSPYHIELVQEFVKRLYDEGKLLVKETPSPYCETCDQYLYEVYIRGTCPHCGAGVGGNVCEDCGRPNDCIDIKEATCTRCGNAPGTRTFKRLYFPLSHYEQQLRAYFESAQMSPHVRVLCEHMLADGLPDISLSHISRWGIPVPVEGFEGQSVFVWFEMASGFLAATQELSERRGSEGGWRDFWTSDEVDIVQFFGFDNAHFFAVFFPAIYMAYDQQIRLPRTMLTNEFYRLDGLKFSTSRNHAVWGGDILSRVPADTVRFHLSYSGPETEQTNFTVSEYQETTRRELVGGFQSWLNELGRKMTEEFGHIVPATADSRTEEQKQFYERLQAFTAEAAASYETRSFSPQRATRVLSELARAAHRFAKEEEPLRLLASHRPQWQTGVALELAAAKTLAILSAPIMPEFARQLWSDLGGQDADLKWEETPRLLQPGTRIGDLTRAYFPEASEYSS